MIDPPGPVRPQTITRRIANRSKAVAKDLPQTLKETGTKLAEAGSEIVQGTKKVIPGVLDMIASIVFVTGGAIGSYAFKENTAADWLFKGGIVAGIGFFIRFIMKVFGFGKGKEKEAIVKDVQLSLDDTKSDQCKQAHENLTAQDSSWAAKKEESKISTYDKSDPDLRTKAGGLLAVNCLAINSRKPAIDNIQPQKGQHVGFSNYGKESKRVDDIKYDNASLLSYVVASRGNEDLTDTSCKALREVPGASPGVPPIDLLGDDKLDDTALDFLPEKFKDVYDVCRLYAQHHTDVDSIQKLFDDGIPTGVDRAQMAGIIDGAVLPGGTKDAVQQYLDKIQNHYNSLKILEKAVIFVKDREKSKNEAERKEALLMKAAIVCGFRFRGDSAEIDREFEKLIRGDEQRKGLAGETGKMKELETKYQEIKSEVLDTSQTMKKVSIQPKDDKFINELGLIELEFEFRSN